MSVPPDRAEEAVAGFLLVHRVAQSHLGSLWVALDERGGRPGVPALLRHVQLPDETAGVLQRLACADRAAMALRHENVLPVVDVLQEGTSLAIVYEYLEGQPLSSLQSWARVRELRFSVGVSLRLMIDLLWGVEALQATPSGSSNGSAFGGLSPASVLLSRDGRTRLCDPLIANAGARLPGLECSTAQLAYMAPEQVYATAPLGPATDVFTGAAMLWELLSGRRLLSGRKETIERKLLQHDLPRLSAPLHAGENVSSALVDLLERSLAREPSRRPPSPGALAIELGRCGHEIASRAQVAQFVGELSGQRFVQLGAALGSMPALPVPAPAAPTREAVAAGRGTAMGIGAPPNPIASSSASSPVAYRPEAAAPSDPRPGVMVLPLLPLASRASLLPLPLVRRRTTVAVASPGSLPAVSVREWRPSEGSRAPSAPSVASKRALLVAMALVVLGAQSWVLRVARSHPHDFWSALAQPTLALSDPNPAPASPSEPATLPTEFAAQLAWHESASRSAAGSATLQSPHAAAPSERDPGPLLLTDAWPRRRAVAER